MIPDYKPTIPEWFHQQFEVGNFLSQTQEWLDDQQKEAVNRRYVFGTVFCWLAAVLLLLASVNLRSTPKEGASPSAQSEPSIFVPTDTIMAPAAFYVEPESKILPLLIEPDSMKRLVDQFGAVEVQASFYSDKGENYSGPLWVRKVMRGEMVYLNDAVLYNIDGPFRFRLPANSTVYIYAPIPGLNWNGGWGVPIKVPATVSCNQPCGCALRLEDLMIAARQK